MLVAEPESSGPVARVSGLVLLGYPLHPPGKPEQLRTAHLPAVRVPMLLVQGTRDAFGTREEIEPVFRALPTRVDFEFIEGGDHSFAVPKSRGLAEADVLKAVCERVAGWLRG
jgi:predicted alpha/beta-hydrolase family hydrolase